MRDHLIHGSIAATVAAAISAGAAYYVPKIEQVTKIVHSKHAWPDLSEAQKSALTERLKEIGAGIEILCTDGACTDFAHDIDDAAEQAQIMSALDRPMGPLGYGLGVQGAKDDARAVALAKALQDATGQDVQIRREQTLPEYPLFILIGKYRAPVPSLPKARRRGPATQSSAIGG